MFHVLIPARFAASRLPGKPLLMIGQQPMIQWVWQRARDSGAASVVVATDDERICLAARAFGAEAVMTSIGHQSGSDRIAEVVRLKGYGPEEVVVNLQGDEPMMSAAIIEQVAQTLLASPRTDIVTAVAPIESLQEFLDPNCVKALRAEDGRALYFSRAPVPWPRDAAADAPLRFQGAWRHIGIYAYRVRSLLEFAAHPASPLELTERLEQLRALERGMRIQLATLPKSPPPGVDTALDLQRVAALLASP